MSRRAGSAVAEKEVFACSGMIVRKTDQGKNKNIVIRIARMSSTGPSMPPLFCLSHWYRWLIDWSIDWPPLPPGMSRLCAGRHGLLPSSPHPKRPRGRPVSHI